MIERYTTDVNEYWDDDFKFYQMARLEIICLAYHQLGSNDSKKDFIEKMLNSLDKSDVLTKHIRQFEIETKHETAALVKYLSWKFPEESKYVHYNLTSSDILDSVYSYQLSKSKDKILKNLSNLLIVLSEKTYADEYGVKYIGRTHGKWAQERNLKSFFKDHHSEFEHAYRSLASINVRFGKLSGPVGENDSIWQEFFTFKQFFGDDVWERTQSTQVIPRHVYIKFFNILKDIANAIERFATNIRNMARSEIGELNEGFAEGQVGSSAMPHKKNPILCENLCGLAKVIRGYNSILDQSTCLWNERDMSHSSVERIVVPDIINLTDFSICRMKNVIEDLHIDYDRIEKNRKNAEEESKSVEKLNQLIKSGMSRLDAYEQIQSEYKGI